MILVLKGEKGSGKSVTIRSLLQLMFGPLVDLVGVPEKADQFTAMASNDHILALDNFDDLAIWMRNPIAAITTGKQDRLRELYTTNEVRKVEYRCWLAVTTRTPDTFQRDDIVDRVLMLPTERLADDKRQSESSLLRELGQRRDEWWGELLTFLNLVVREIRKNGIPEQGGLRMEDWACMCSVFAAVEGQPKLWADALKWIKKSQGDFLLDGNIVLEAVEHWLKHITYLDTWLTARELRDYAGVALFGQYKAEHSWPKDSKTFGRRFSEIKRELQARIQPQGFVLHERTNNGYQQYRFEKVSTP